MPKPALVLPVLVLLSALLLFQANPLLGAYGLLGLIVIVRLFWTRQQPAIIFWALLHQWLQVNGSVLQSGLMSVPLRDVLVYGARADSAYVLAMTGLLAFAFGLWLTTRRLTRESLTAWLETLQPQRCMLTYLVFLVAYDTLTLLAPPWASEAVNAVGLLKWGFFYLFFCAVLHTRRYIGLLALFIGLDFVVSLVDIFASFRAILIMPFILLPVFMRDRLSIGTRLAFVMFGVTIISVGLIWTAVKGDYRVYLAHGEKGQVIRVSNRDALGELVRLVGALDSEKLSQAVINMTSRVSYIDFLSGVIDNVPARQPHEDGALTFAAIEHVLKPRMFFPNKATLEDSLVLNKYIGHYVADHRTTSMSIGYVGDFYIDFGWYAPVAIFFFGLVLGRQYAFLYRLPRNPGWGLFLVMPMFFLFYLFEQELVKTFALTLVYTVVSLLIGKFGLPLIRRMVERRRAPTVVPVRSRDPFAV